MIRILIITICFCTSVWANDIYVDQTEINDDKAALKTPIDVGSTYQQPPGGSNFEKNLIPIDSAKHCSVLAGCQ